MTAPKKQASWNIIIMVAIGVLGVATSQMDRLLGKGVDEGALAKTVEVNSAEIHRVDTKGCEPSKLIGNRVAVLEGLALRNKDDIVGLNKKLDKIIDLLTNRP